MGGDPQLNTAYPTYSNDYGGSSGFTNNYNFITSSSGGTDFGSNGGGGGASCIQINIEFYGTYVFITVSACNLMEYTQRTALLDPDCPDPQGTIGVLPPENPCPIAGYTKDVNGNCVPLITNFNLTTLTELQKALFNKALFNLKENCFGYTLLNEVKEVIVKIGTVNNYQAQYDPDNSTISFRSEDDISSYNLGAELFHAYQQQIYGILSDIKII